MLAALVVHKEEADYHESRHDLAEAEADRLRAEAGVDGRLWETFRVGSYATRRACERLLGEEEAAGLAPTGGFSAHYPECLVEATAELCAAYKSRSVDGGIALSAVFARWWPLGPPTGKWPDQVPPPPEPAREPRALPSHLLW
jgi:hypothetical protein